MHNKAPFVKVLPGTTVYNVNTYKNRVLLVHHKKRYSLPFESKKVGDYDTFDTISRLYCNTLKVKLRGLRSITTLKSDNDIVIYKNNMLIDGIGIWVPIQSIPNYDIEKISLEIINQEILTKSPK